jgi:3'(2'), 5'-bisphosphate nucleotidase
MADLLIDRDGLLAEVVAIAREAGERILAHYHETVAVGRKADDSPVTQADLDANRHIVERLKSATPDVPVVAEESELPDYAERREWRRFWLVDPLDGTKEFVQRNGEFTVNIALVEDGIPTLGVVHAPARGLFYYAERARGSFEQVADGEPTRIASAPADPSQPLSVVTSRSHPSEELERYLEQFEVRERVYAGSSLKFCAVAKGDADIYPRLGPTMEWDVAAGDCVYRHSAWEGQHRSELTYNKPDLRNDGFVIGF